jgi:hypothetical protein
MFATQPVCNAARTNRFIYTKSENAGDSMSNFSITYLASPLHPSWGTKKLISTQGYVEV